MANAKADIKTAHQVEHSILEIDLLPIDISVATKFLSALASLKLSPQSLAEIIKADPAFASLVLRLAAQRHARFNFDLPLIPQALEKIPLRLLRDKFLSAKTYCPLNADEPDEQLKKGLRLYSIAVACCAKGIAESILTEAEAEKVYLAGLLHNIGNLALAQVMPRSLHKIIKEARTQNADIRNIQQKHLGTDYTILGKRLAQKWGFPELITQAVWLHRSYIKDLSPNIAGGKIAQIVQLADCITRQCGIGDSGSCDSPDSLEKIAESVGISSENLQQIQQGLTNKVRQKCEAVGLDKPNLANKYLEVLQSTIAMLAQDNTKLNDTNSKLQPTSSSFEFMQKLLLDFSSSDSSLQTAARFAACWQKFYQTGRVCLYLLPQNSVEIIEAVILENSDAGRTVFLDGSAAASLIPESISDEFGVTDADEQSEWLFEQLDVDFELSCTKLVSLFSGTQPAGVIAFEFRQPVEAKLLEENFSASASLGGALLGLACKAQKQQFYAEEFARSSGNISREISKPQVEAKKPETESKPEPETPIEVEQSKNESADLMAALAEMASGAAHELNNPLSVISGRIQLLAENETDDERKKILEQIKENAEKASELISDLMSFANPRQPQPTQTNVGQILEEAIQLTSQMTHLEDIKIDIQIDEQVKNIFVDSGQIVSSIANVLCNSLESYTDEAGTIEISASEAQAGEFVQVKISDFGGGMDEKTIGKAIHPFFSGKPAGRKRGMGLSYTQRLIELNNGSLTLESRLGEGTTVTILLPCK